MQRNIYMLIAYDGTQFKGWQTQPGQRTVQQLLQDAVQRVVRHPVDLIGSGRTDSGVHAAGQVANFATSCAIPAEKLRHAIGSRLPGDVAILDSRDVHPDFHATRSALSKQYRYAIHHQRRRPVEFFEQRHVWHCWHRLDLDAMREAAALLVGQHDFASMCTVRGLRENTVRTVIGVRVDRHLDRIHVDVVGKGFLYNQVRIMVGTLVNVGRAFWEPARISTILEGKDRSLAGPTMPAEGLSLRWVRYPDALLRPPVEADAPA